MPSIAIFGSCVSRDVFEFFPDQLKVKDYFARSSIISVMSPEIGIKETQINLDSSFQRRMVQRDLNRSFLELKDDGIDYLLIDFIDERFGLLLNKSTNQYITRSVEFVKANFEKTIFKDFNRVDRKNEMVKEFWEKSCLMFIDKLKENFKPEKVLLHKALWSEVYLDQGQAQYFDSDKLEEIRTSNKILEGFYSFFENNFPGIKVIEAKNRLIADKQHKWGLSPFHYQQSYYKEIGQQLLNP